MTGRNLMPKAFIKAIVIFATLFLLTSCSNIRNGITDHDSEHIQETVYEETYELICAYPSVESFVETEYSAFNNSNCVIVEWGDKLELKDGDGNNIFLRDKRYGKTYVCYPVKYVFMFKSTIEDELDLVFSGEFKNSLYYVLEPNTEILKDYDDIVAVCSECADLIEKGRTDLVNFQDPVLLDFSDYGHDESLELPIYTYGSTNPSDALLLVASGCIHRLEHQTYLEDVHKVRLIKINDGKVDLNNSYDGSAGNTAYYLFEKANEMLIKTGHEDKIFKDGMTIEELDEYFKLVTNPDTFALLFGS